MNNVIESTTGIKQAHDSMREAAEKNNTTKTRVMTNETMPIGTAIRQGDVLIMRVDSIPESHKLSTDNMQIAKGTTKGSRHILLNNGDVNLFYSPTANPLEGPSFKSPKEIELSHPEHANFKFPAGCYISTYERDFAKEELAAVRD